MANTCNFYIFYVCPISRCIYLQCNSVDFLMHSEVIIFGFFDLQLNILIKNNMSLASNIGYL